MSDQLQINSTSVLAVEGKDETNFFAALLENQNIIGVQVVDIGGKDKFSASFRALANIEEFKNITRLGVVRDAESNLALSAFQSICGVLKQTQLPVPRQPGQVTAGTMPLVGIYIMPDNRGTGMLEDLCLQTVQEQPVNSCIEDYLECFLKYHSEKEKKRINRSKSRVMAYLATRSPIVNSLGLGAKEGYWDFTHPCFDDLKKFLESLYR